MTNKRHLVREHSAAPASSVLNKSCPLSSDCLMAGNMVRSGHKGGHGARVRRRNLRTIRAIHLKYSRVPLTKDSALFEIFITRPNLRSAFSQNLFFGRTYQWSIVYRKIMVFCRFSLEDSYFSSGFTLGNISYSQGLRK